MSQSFSNKPVQPGRRKLLKGASAVAGMATIGMPALSFAQNKPIKIGMPTILSGRVAILGISSRNAVMMEVEKFKSALTRQVTL